MFCGYTVWLLGVGLKYSSKYGDVKMMSYSAECTLIVMSCVMWLLRH